MSKALMPKWFVPALVVSGAVAVVSGLRVLKDSRVFGGEESPIVEEDWETVEVPSDPDEEWMNETLWESPAGEAV